MSYATMVLGTVLAMLSPSAVQPQPITPITPVSVQVVRVAGSGCLTSPWISWRDDQINFYYPSTYLAGVGPGMLPTDRRKNCQLVLSIVPPAGYTFAIVSAVHRGTAVIEPGASAVWQAVHKFDGDPAPVPVRHTFVGPFDEMWERVESTPAEALVWASCDNPRPLVIISQLAVDAGTSDLKTTSWIIMENVDLYSPNEYHLAWRTC